MLEIILVTENDDTYFANIVAEHSLNQGWSNTHWLEFGKCPEVFRDPPHWSPTKQVENWPVAVRVNPIWRGKWIVSAFIANPDDMLSEREKRYNRHAVFVPIEIMDDPNGVIPPEEPKKRHMINTPQTREERKRAYWS